LFKASSRLARLQGLLEVGPATILAAMLGDLGVPTLCSIRTMTRFFFSFLEHQTNHAVFFNARGLVYECIFDDLLFFCRTDLLGNLFLITSLLDLLFLLFFFLDHHAGHPARHDARILLMSASSMSSEIFHHRFDLLELCFL
jgi:hypothetical protein